MPPTPSSSTGSQQNKHPPTSPLHNQRQVAATRRLRIEPPRASQHASAQRGQSNWTPRQQTAALNTATTAGTSDISAYIGSGASSGDGEEEGDGGAHTAHFNIDAFLSPPQQNGRGLGASGLNTVARQPELGEQTAGDLDLDDSDDVDDGETNLVQAREDDGRAASKPPMDSSARRLLLRQPSGGRSSTPLLHKQGSSSGSVDNEDSVGGEGGGGGGSRGGGGDGLLHPDYSGLTSPGRGGSSSSRSPSPLLGGPRARSSAHGNALHGGRTASSMRRMRSRSPLLQPAASSVRTRYVFASFFLVVSLVAFTVQTELAAKVQHERGWDKAYAMLYATHGSWTFLWPAEIVILRLRRGGWRFWEGWGNGGEGGRFGGDGAGSGTLSQREPWRIFWRRHMALIRGTAEMVRTGRLDVPNDGRRRQHGKMGAASSSSTPPGEPWWYLFRTTALVTVSLTVAALSWYVAVSMTSPGDLTAIYNCSAFFAYAFSVPLLGERLRWDKAGAVAISIIGVLVVAYGDSGSTTPSNPQRPPDGADVPLVEPDPATRFAGNLIIGGGSVLYGLYEVLYKRLACPPDGCSPGRGVVFANFFGSCIGAFTLLVLWIPIPILHWTGIEPFEIPDAYTALLLGLSVVANAIFAGSFLVLISLTSPVLSSVAALLTIFIVAVVDWLLTGVPLGPSSLIGGAMIAVAFALLSWATWREMVADEVERRLREEREQEREDAEEDDDVEMDADADDGEADSDEEHQALVGRRHSGVQGV